MTVTTLNPVHRLVAYRDTPPAERRKRLTLLACILGSSAAFLDGTLVNVALPAIRASLHGGLATQQWVLDAYLLTLSSLLLIGGSLGDAFGRRRIFAGGVAGFGAASVLCAVAPSAPLLIGARALQGVAGALLVPSTLALIMDTFAEHERAAAIGAWTAWTGIATVLGPLAGGVLLAIGSWRYVFLVNLPLVLTTLWLLKQAPHTEPTPRAGIDWLGGFLCALGLAGPIYALIEQPHYGWTAAQVRVPLLGGCVLLIAFVTWQTRAPHPMLPLALFRERNFAVGNLVTLVFYAALSAMTFILVVFLQQVGGYSALKAGLSLTPMSILTFLLAKRFGAWADRFGPRIFMGFGPLVAGTGLVLLVTVDAHANYVTQVLPGVTLFALGLAMTVAPLTAAVLGAVPAPYSGVASGINNAVARAAGLIVIAALGAVIAGSFSARVHAALPGGAPAFAAAVSQASTKPLVIDASAFPAGQRPAARLALISASTDSYHLAILSAAGMAVLSGLLSIGAIANPRPTVAAAHCPGGAICGASTDVAYAGVTRSTALPDGRHPAPRPAAHVR